MITMADIHMESFAIVCAFAFSLIVLDIVCGVINAFKNQELSSSAMRNGLIYKSAEILLVLFSGLCQLFMQAMEGTGISFGIPSDVVNLVGAYIISMEVLSIIENICLINPQLKVRKILAIFGKEVDTNPEEDVE